MFSFFFFNDTATTEIYTLSLHDALPIWRRPVGCRNARVGDELAAAALQLRGDPRRRQPQPALGRPGGADRKSTRLNSSHLVISYAVFCLKKKKKKRRNRTQVEPTSRTNP